MSEERYPKSREELEGQVAALRAKVAERDAALEQAARLLRQMELEAASLRRRKVPGPARLDPGAADSFRRPAFSRGLRNRGGA